MRYIITLLTAFGLSFAGVASADEGGFSGSLELKYSHDLSAKSVGSVTYRARAGWRGYVNDSVNWGLSLSTTDTPLESYSFRNLYLEQAYAKWAPVDGLAVTVGKYEVYSKFNKYSVLRYDDLYAEGVKVKFKKDLGSVSVYAGATAEELSSYNGVWGENSYVASGWAGVKAEVSNVKVKVGVGAENNSVLADGNLTLVQAKVGVSTDVSGVRVGAYGLGSSDVKEVTDGDDLTWVAGAYVGSEEKETYGYSVGVSYYNLNESSWNLATVNTDYVSPVAVEAKGVAVQASFNPADNTNVLVKYNKSLGSKEDASQTAVAELRFKF